jgi:hypothetical protein
MQLKLAGVLHLVLHRLGPTQPRTISCERAARQHKHHQRGTITGIGSV